MGTKRTSCGPRYRHRKAAAACEASPSVRSSQSPPPPGNSPAPTSATGSAREAAKGPILGHNDPSAEPPPAQANAMAAAAASAFPEQKVEESPVSSKSRRGGVSAIRDFVAATVAAADALEGTMGETPGSSKSDPGVISAVRDFSPASLSIKLELGKVSAVRDFPPGCGSRKLELGKVSPVRDGSEFGDQPDKEKLEVEISEKKASLAGNNHVEKLDVKLHSGTKEIKRADGNGLIVKVPPGGVIICGLMAPKYSPWSNKKKTENKPCQR